MTGHARRKDDLRIARFIIESDVTRRRKVHDNGLIGRDREALNIEEGISVQMTGIPFGTTDWSKVEQSEHKGERGFAYWRTQQFGSIRVRMVEYTPGYLADHWCSKGHILLCMEGELHTEFQDGRKFTLTPGTSYQVADNVEPHRSYTELGAKLFVVD